jgi:hypothetical protein
LAGWPARHKVSHEAAPAASKHIAEYQTPHLDEAVVDAAMAEEEGGVTGPHVEDIIHSPIIKRKSYARRKTSPSSSFFRLSSHSLSLKKAKLPAAI